MTASVRPSPIAADQRRTPEGVWSRFLPSLLAYAFVVIALILTFHLPGATDYVGADNDDAMRLVEVRDWLAGQSWFDMTQYRLGLEGGTLMHWSRLVDLPIGALIRLFSVFPVSPVQAEALALMVWPLALAVLFIGAAGFGGRRIGGVSTMHIAFGLASLFVFTSVRFHPGSIDHHNLQQVLMVFLAACLIDRRRGRASHAMAGITIALAIAIGAETMPIVAVACACVAMQWAWHGEAFGEAARAFGLSLSLAITAFFVATVPPSQYGMVSCDSLSLGFYALSAIGGAGLFFLALILRHTKQRQRFVALAGLATAGVVATVLIAPECLGSPLAGLDPMLRDLWLNSVTEAQPIVSQLRHQPATVGGFYAVGLFAIAICVFRIIDREKTEIHLVLLALIGIAWLVSLIQVRGSFLANALTILPLSLIIDDLRRQSHAEPENINAGFAYVITVLMSVPVVWVFMGAVTTKGLGNETTVSALTRASAPVSNEGKCVAREDLASLATMPSGVVAAPSDSGTAILRYTSHRVLSAPYHRNQAGMLTELHIGLSSPNEAEAFLRGADVSILAFCPTDPQSRLLMHLKPEGLYAQLEKGTVPAYLEPVDGNGSRELQLYRVRAN